MRPPRSLIAKIRPTSSSTRVPFRFRQFSTTPRAKLENRVYDSVRNVNDLQTLLLLSSSSRQPLITLWTASWASIPSNAAISLLTTLISTEKIGQTAASGPNGTSTSVGFAEIEADAPDMIADDISGRYMVNSVPMLLAFSRGEAQTETRITDTRLLQDRKFLIDWIETEARRGGLGGAGGNLFGGWFKGWGGGGS